jgi:hypothetical protein
MKVYIPSPHLMELRPLALLSSYTTIGIFISVLKMNWEPMKLVILSWVVPDPIHMLELAMLLENTWIIYILEIQKI